MRHQNNNKINIVCDDQIGLTLFNNSTNQSNFYLSFNEKNDNKKILSKSVEFIFNLHNYKKPFYFYDTLIDSLIFTNIIDYSFHGINKITGMIFSNDPIYKLKIIGVCDSDIYYIGTGKETVNNINKSLQEYYTLHGNYYFNDKKLELYMPLINCNFNERYSLNIINFVRTTNSTNTEKITHKIIDCNDCNNKFFEINQYNTHNNIECNVCKIKTCNITNHLNKTHIKCPVCYVWVFSLDNHKCECAITITKNNANNLTYSTTIHDELQKFKDLTDKLKKTFLHSNSKFPSILPSSLRHNVWTTYFGKVYEAKCFCCRRSSIDVTTFEAGHVISKHDGGLNTLENLRPICGQCNKSMNKKNMYDFIAEFNMWNIQ